MYNTWNRPGGNGQGAVSGFGVDVRDFGSIHGSNFRDTLDEAVSCAYAESAAPENGQEGVNMVLIPSGKYSMGDTTLNFPGTGPKYTPGLKGLGGMGSVVLEWENYVPGAWISTGSENPGAGIGNASIFQSFENLELRCLGGISRYGGIKSRFGFMQQFTDVMVRGLLYSDQPWNAGVAFDFRVSNQDSQNHQHLRLTRCYANYCQIGYWFGEATWSVTAVDVHANGCNVAPVMYEQSAVVSWWGGNTQCGASPVDTWHWNAGTQPAVHCGIRSLPWFGKSP